MKYTYLIIVIIVLSCIANAQTGKANFDNSNKTPLLIEKPDSTIPPELIGLNNAAVRKALGGNYEAAIVDFRQIVAQAPDCLEAQFNLGNALKVLLTIK